MENVLGLVVNLLFVALWCCLGFFAVRFVANRYFHEPKRADIVAVGTVLAFAIGALWPFSSRLGLVTSANTMGASNEANAAPAPTQNGRDVSVRCKTVTGPSVGAGFGSLDNLETRNNKAITDGSQLSYNAPYVLHGWAADVSHERPTSAVCLVVDGRVARGAKSLYGARRADVVAVSHIPALLATGFSITIVPGLLPRGRHVLQVATLSEHGVLMTVAGQRSVTVR